MTKEDEVESYVVSASLLHNRIEIILGTFI
jgi:hypothetical protein